MDNRNPKVSVIVPAYNAEATIGRCIDSILGQTLTELEVIVVDDGSIDRTGKICSSYNDSRLRYCRKGNGGPSTARNLGLSLARGEYVGFVDADDYIVDDMYEIMYSASTKNDTDLCVCDYKIIFDNRKEAYYTDLVQGGFFDKEEIRTKVLPFFLGAQNGEGNIRNTDWSVLRRLFRRSFLSQLNLFFDESLITSEDCLFSYLATYGANSMVYLKNEHLYINIRNTESLTRKYLLDYWQQRCKLMDKLEAVINTSQCAWKTETFPLFVLLCIRPSFNNIAYGFGSKSILHSLREFKTIVNDPRTRKMCEVLSPDNFNDEWSKLYKWCRDKRYITLYLYHMDVVQHNKLFHFIRRVQKGIDRRLNR